MVVPCSQVECIDGTPQPLMYEPQPSHQQEQPPTHGPTSFLATYPSFTAVHGEIGADGTLEQMERRVLF